MRVLLELLFLSLRGRAVHWFRQMKQPRYLVGFLVAAAYFGLMLLPQLFRSGHRANGPGLLAELFGKGQEIEPLHTLVALVLLFLVCLWWLVPWGEGALNLNTTELHVLLPAPLARRHIIRYSLLKSQPGILFGALMIALFMLGGSGISRIFAWLSTWFLLTLWYLHGRVRGLWLGHLKRLEPGVAWRNRLVLLAALLLFWFLAGRGLREIMSAVPGAGVWEFSRHLHRALERASSFSALGLLHWALIPFLSLTQPLVEQVAETWHWSAFLGPFLLLLLHAEWVVRTEGRFEEATLKRARKVREWRRRPQLRLRRVSRPSRAEAPFSLPALGWPEMAILWKNWMAVARIPIPRFLRNALMIALAAAGLPALSLVPVWVLDAVVITAFMFLGLFPIFSGSQWRNDFRLDLPRVELLRAWPLVPWRLAAVEVITPALQVTLNALVALFTLLLVHVGLHTSLYPPGRGQWAREAGERLAVWLGCPVLLAGPMVLASLLPLLLAVALISSAIQNLLCLVFPSWVQLGLQRRQAAGMGQNLLVTLVLMLALAVSLVPGALAVALVLALQSALLGWALTVWELPLLAVLVAFPVLLLSALLIGLSGKAWERMDPSAEVLAGG